jgi:iron only hydrogenase large subunit-like protein
MEQSNRNYFHSVRLQREKCKGCTNCIKKCPTEAIRVRDGKAHIINERCIDCGECIRTCPHHAKAAVTDGIQDLERFKYTIALPAPTLYGQFKNLKSIDKVLNGLKLIGFDDVYEVAKGADIVSTALRERLASKTVRPVISSACPAVVRLIQVRFPDLLENIVDVNPPLEVAAAFAKKEFAEKHRVDEKDIGAFFITPCPAKMTSIKNPIRGDKSHVDGAISILEIYALLAGQLKKPDMPAEAWEMASAYGVGWANSGGESAALGVDGYLSVDGIHNVIRVLEEIENDRLTDLDFFEGLACTGGCVGGPLVFENGYVARNRLRLLVEGLPKESSIKEKIACYAESPLVLASGQIKPRPVLKLDEDRVEAMHKMERMEGILKRLPGLDCGSCGAPTCKTLAEDIVRGEAKELDCIFILKDRVKKLAEEMVELSSEDIFKKDGGDNDSSGTD